MNQHFSGTSYRIKMKHQLRRTLVQMGALFLFSCLTGLNELYAQQKKPVFTKADTLCGSLNENRDWWDVLRYDITVKPDYEKKEIEGSVTITFKALKKGTKLQIDLQEPLIVDQVSELSKVYPESIGRKFSREGQL